MHDRCSIWNFVWCSVFTVLYSAIDDVFGRTRMKTAWMRSSRSEIILSQLDLDNSSERTCVALIVPIPLVLIKTRGIEVCVDC